MPIAVARRLLPPGSIVGVSCNTPAHVHAAVRDGADYIGIGAVYGTQTKKLTEPLVGVRGIAAMLDGLGESPIKAVAIGGIKATNALRILHSAIAPNGRPLDGVAIVSDIVASREPAASATKLSRLIRAFQQEFATGIGIHSRATIVGSIAVEPALERVQSLFQEIKKSSPLVHQITNNVVATQSANITLAVGASPIMATAADEMEDLSRIPGALLVNIGTLVPDTKLGMLEAGYFANLNGKPIVLDPVGIGASTFRKSSVNGTCSSLRRNVQPIIKLCNVELLDRWQPSVIKGNAGELAAFAGSTEVKSKGVDSVGSGFSDPALFVQALARQERCIVVLTGKTDYVSDGHLVVCIENGHELLGQITGAGCMAGSLIATFCAAQASLTRGQSGSAAIEGQLVDRGMLYAAVGGLLTLEIAAEQAVPADGSAVGRGTFLSRLIDRVGFLTQDDITRLAKISIQVPGSPKESTRTGLRE
ncbi:hypothetical protein HGRIS_002827 [Hohenbuehelia grisea]|uniref:hydroxyethylthiazole kinase n=1 Tax=Hohenbuehelia grisea TaxID=104357 RepID=A0ABR3JLM5_9AGAR